jgi:flagellar basal-body rod protein FlgC
MGDLDKIFRSLSVTGSGLSAERTRMEVIAENIANANVTRTKEGGPYRRREVVFQTLLDESFGRKGRAAPAGVRVAGVVQDTESPLVEVQKKGHPDADKDGKLLLPNVSVTYEMVDLITAARAYEANLQAGRLFRDMIREALGLFR